MPVSRLAAVVLAVFVAHGAYVSRSLAADVQPADVKSVAVHPAKVALTGADDAAQLVVTATLNDGRFVDLTQEAQYGVADSKSATVQSGGRVVPQANGTSEIVVSFANTSVRVPLAVKGMGENLPLNFTN